MANAYYNMHIYDILDCFFILLFVNFTRIKQKNKKNQKNS